ncbi:MAG: UbiX family flavin prenyltransferase [Rikenellaceae bacterium]
MRIILAITAASGAIYARQIADLLLESEQVEQIALVYSRSAREVMSHEDEYIAEHERITIYDNDDMFAPIASGSARYEAMIVAPCSVGTLARVASGYADTLITRAADVMLKERRRLVLVLRESPLSLVHLRNMVALAEAGAIVMPASPSFYMGADSVEALAATISSRAVAMVGIDGGVKAWDGKKI